MPRNSRNLKRKAVGPDGIKNLTGNTENVSFCKKKNCMPRVDGFIEIKESNDSFVTEKN